MSEDDNISSELNISDFIEPRPHEVIVYNEILNDLKSIDNLDQIPSTNRKIILINSSSEQNLD